MPTRGKPGKPASFVYHQFIRLDDTRSRGDKNYRL
ncbi:unnamed protein product [Spirodela intermedia]|uniref:Uncharacterized protein n=2 Tax=Spirodela intermedia TaxID=51605 RepID=A0A7I8K363_SPIIN|nr:unnamed protein product [Spirodela intermedia]CAA6655508.1 unnamed protein product [Spirodela intermedia]CAA7390796.1 unnamed protein product [Spirodela intermedia]